MKKILLTTAAITVISTTAFAETSTLVQDTFYLRGDLGATYFSKFKANGAKIKGQAGPLLDIGVGYNFTDSIRAELVYNHPFVTSMKGTGRKVNGNTVFNGTFKVKPTINAVWARVAGDVVDLGAGKLFVTAGLGWAQVKNTVKLSVTEVTTPAGGPAITDSAQYQIKSKNKNNLAWTLGLGGTVDVSEGVHLDIGYSYRDYGKSKAIKYTDGVGDIETIKGCRFRSHNVTAGVRFDI